MGPRLSACPASNRSVFRCTPKQREALGYPGRLNPRGGSHMRIAVGGYLVSANTFATQRISLERFQRAVISGDDLLNRMGRGENAIAGFLSGAREHNWEVVPLHFFFSG